MVTFAKSTKKEKQEKKRRKPGHKKALLAM
jgi:hypothetical protein